LALLTDGTVYAWGQNDTGQLGDTTTTNRSLPVQVRAPSGTGFLQNVTAILAVGKRSLALQSNGTLLAWGNNDVGQLGDGTNNERHRPVQVLAPSGSGFLTGVAKIGGGGFHTMALTTSGQLYAWGDNTYGQLGIGSTDLSRDRPVLVDLQNVQAIAG